MENYSENIVRRLIALNMERMQLNQEAGRNVQQLNRKKLLLELAAQSEGYIMELEYVLKLYGGSVGAAASQSIQQRDEDLKNTSDQSIFLNILRHEEQVIDTYNEVIKTASELDNTLFEKIRSQKSEIMEIQLKLNLLKE